MKVFVFAYDRYDTITTSLMLEEDGVEHTVLCHTEEQKQKFIDGGRVRPDRLLVTGKDKGLSRNRNAALDLMEEGEWALFLVDDLTGVYELSNYDKATSPLPIDYANQNYYRLRFKTKVSMAQFHRRAEEYAELCEANGAWLGGFTASEGALYRKKHYLTNVMCDGRAWVVRKSDIRFDENANCIDDYSFTAANIQRFGIIVVNQWIEPACKRYGKGGYGSKEDRMEQKIRECAYLVGKYPHLLAYRPKKGFPYGAHIVFRQNRNKPQVRIDKRKPLH